MERLEADKEVLRWAVHSGPNPTLCHHCHHSHLSPTHLTARCPNLSRLRSFRPSLPSRSLPLALLPAKCVRRLQLARCDEQRLHFRTTLATLRAEFERYRTVCEAEATAAAAAAGLPAPPPPTPSSSLPAPSPSSAPPPLLQPEVRQQPEMQPSPRGVSSPAFRIQIPGKTQQQSQQQHGAPSQSLDRQQE